MWFFTGVAVAGSIGAWRLFRWLRKWRDPAWDSKEKQARSFLWSKKGTGWRV